jgi:hypothetical protein
MNTAKVYNMHPARQKQADPFNLQSLPFVSPARDGWPVVEAALRRAARRRSLGRYAAGALAAAATVALVLGLYWQQSAPERALPMAIDLAGDAARNQAPAPAGGTLDALVALSQRLESRLRHIRAEVGGLPANAVVYQVELEDLVVQVDEQLSRQPDSLALWNQRVALLLDLERLYENSLRREYDRTASL